MDVFDEIVRLRKLGRKCALATITEVNGSIPSYASAKMLVRDDGSIAGTIGGGCVEAEVWTAAREAMETGRARMLRFSLSNDAAYENGLICGGQVSIFVEPVTPRPRLLVFGGGHISRALCQVSALAGFAVEVVDDREEYATKERFPEADAVHAGEYEALFAGLELNAESYAVIVTRGHRDDLRVLRLLAPVDVRYAAMIGSKRKVLGLVKELEAEGVDGARFANLHAPMGLDIGAVTPEEIAVAVVAEMIAVRRSAASEWKALSKSMFVNGKERVANK